MMENLGAIVAEQMARILFAIAPKHVSVDCIFYIFQSLFFNIIFQAYVCLGTIFLFFILFHWTFSQEKLQSR